MPVPAFHFGSKNLFKFHRATAREQSRRNCILILIHIWFRWYLDETLGLDITLTLEQVNTFETIVMEYMYFTQQRHECGKIKRRMQSNVCAPPQMHVLKPNPWSDSLRRWGCGEEIRPWGWNPHDWDYHPLKRQSRDSPHPLWGYSKKIALFENQKSLTRSQICWLLDLELPNHQNYEK